MSAESLEVRQTKYHRMPEYVCQDNMTVRVLRNSPQRVEVQIRHPKHFMQASMTAEEARALAAKLIAAADDADGH